MAAVGASGSSYGTGRQLRAEGLCQQLNTLGFDKVVVLDPHSDAAAAAVNNMVTVAQQHCLLQSAGLRQAIAAGELMLVAPDAGALKKIHPVAKACGAGEFAILGKERDLASGALSGFPAGG